MTSQYFLAALIVLAVWAFAGYVIWQWGPGFRKRSVWCPVLNKRAVILADQRETEFRNSYAGFTVIDVKNCSMFKSGPVMCHKECLHRL